MNTFGEMVSNQRNHQAAQELIGALLLILIAVASAAFIYFQVLPLPLPEGQTNIHLMGYVETGTPIIEHMGGETLDEYEIFIDGTLYRHESTDPWEIGELNSLENFTLPTENDTIHVMIFKVIDENNLELVFDALLSGNPLPPETEGHPILMSSLDSDTTDEDLICYSQVTTPTITPTSFIYRWMLDGNSITHLHLPFDTQDAYEVTDYSGNNHDVLVTNATWLSEAVLGGGYHLVPDDYLTIPYCFPTNTIDTFTLQLWINTTQENGLLLNYNGTTHFQFFLQNGSPCLITTSSTSESKQTVATGTINDGTWHHLAATYNWLTGDVCIYIDGEIDLCKNTYTAGTTLGSTTGQTGYIGRQSTASAIHTLLSTSFETEEEYSNWQEHNSTGNNETFVWDTLTYDDFNSEWGNWERSSTYYCGRSSTYYHEGTRSAYILGRYNWEHYIQHSDYLDVHTKNYTTLTIDFWWMWRMDWSSHYDWYVSYYDGSHWHTIDTIDYPGSYEEEAWYHKIITINESEYTFPTNMKIRITCGAGWSSHVLHLDQIYVNGSRVDERANYIFERADTSVKTPHSGGYSLAGSGDFDPTFIAFNRTAINCSTYQDKTIDFWFAANNITTADEFGLYYKNNSDWTPLYTINDTTGTIDWTKKSNTIPDSITNLVLQFRWTTSSENTYFLIDDLTINGTLHTQSPSYNGSIDDLIIYKKCLTAEQIYQNYLFGYNHDTSRSAIVSEETQNGDIWQCIIYPNDTTIDDTPIESNFVIITPYLGGD